MRKDKFVFPPTPLRPHAQLTTTLTPTHSQYVFPTYNFSPIQLPPNLSSRFPSNLSSRFPSNLSSRFPSNLSFRFPPNLSSRFPSNLSSRFLSNFFHFLFHLFFFYLFPFLFPLNSFLPTPSQPSPDFSSFQPHHIFSPVFIHFKIRPILPSSSFFPILFLFFLLPNSFPLLPSR